MLLDRVFPLVRQTGQLAYVSRTKAFPSPSPCLPYEWLNPIMWYLIWNFFFPKVSMVPIFYQYNWVCLTSNFWRCAWFILIPSNGNLTWNSHIGCGVSFELSWCARFHGSAQTYADRIIMCLKCFKKPTWISGILNFFYQFWNNLHE